jgi:hypothetical protein
MATTVNLLEYNNALMVSNNAGRAVQIADYSTDWVAVQNSTSLAVSVVSDVRLVSSRYSILVNPIGSSALTISLANQPLKLYDNNRVLSFNCKLKTGSSCTVSALLQIDGEAAESPHIHIFSSGEFSAVHTNRVLVPDDGELHTCSITITVTNHGTKAFYLTNFHLIHDLGFYENPFVEQMRDHIPDFYWEYDSEEEYPTYPFFRLMDILSSAAGDVRRIYNGLFPYDTDEFLTPDDQTGYWAKSSLTTPALVREDYIPWLSQFNGTRIVRNVILSDGSVYFNNKSLERDFVEWQLNTGYYGYAAGSRAAIQGAAQQFLIRTKDGTESTRSVAVTTRYLDDPFVILVQTLENETLDAAQGESSQLILNSVNMARPLGYKILHETVDEFAFTFDDLALGRFDEIRWG